MKTKLMSIIAVAAIAASSIAHASIVDTLKSPTGLGVVAGAVLAPVAGVGVVGGAVLGGLVGHEVEQSAIDERQDYALKDHNRKLNWLYENGSGSVEQQKDTGAIPNGNPFSEMKGVKQHARDSKV